MGAPGRRALAQPGRPDGRGATGVVAELGSVGLGAGEVRPGDVGLACGTTGTGTWRSGAGMGLARRRSPTGTGPAGGTHVGRGPAAASGPACSACRSARSRAQLGRTRRAAACVGSAAPGRAACASRASGHGPTATAPCTRARRAPAPSTDLGYAPGRERGSGTPCPVGRRVEPAAPALMGRRAPGTRRAGPGRDRLGGSASQRASRGPTGAFMERAGRTRIVGRSQD
jgi:hypothetical protein